MDWLARARGFDTEQGSESYQSFRGQVILLCVDQPGGTQGIAKTRGPEVLEPPSDSPGDYVSSRGAVDLLVLPPHHRVR